MKNDVAAVHIADSLYEYITQLAQATRSHPMIQLGLSPRGALAICRMAKAYAYVYDRDFVVPDDIAAVFCDVCTHRMLLSAKARLANLAAGDILNEVLESVEKPVSGSSSLLSGRGKRR